MSELTMTVVCKCCDNQYGAWRTHCPACGTRSHYVAPVKEEPRAPRQKKSEAQRERRPDECILCRRGRSQTKCGSCNEPIHERCLKYHIDDCMKFVAERDAIVAMLPKEGEAAIKRALEMGRMDIADRVRAALKAAGHEVHT